MNQRNVGALAAICEELVRERGFAGPNGPVGESWWEGKDFAEMGAFLASRGVLVPSALTDKEIDDVAYYCPPEYEDVFPPKTEYQAWRAELERIAKGEE